MQTNLRKHGKQVNKIINKVLTSPKIIPTIELTQATEIEFYKAITSNLAEKFSTNIQIMQEDESSEQKAINAIPGKPVIIID